MLPQNLKKSLLSLIVKMIEPQKWSKVTNYFYKLSFIQFYVSKYSFNNINQKLLKTNILINICTLLTYYVFRRQN